MYETILVTLDTTDTDRTIIAHIKLLAKQLGSRVVVMHVADGWAAQRFGAEAVSPEVTQDQQYLAQVQAEFTAEDIPCETVLAFGKPADEIIRWAEEHCPDLIAMATHGHRFLAELVLGETASRVQHHVAIPVLLLRVGSDICTA